VKDSGISGGKSLFSALCTDCTHLCATRSLLVAKRTRLFHLPCAPRRNPAHHQSHAQNFHHSRRHGGNQARPDATGYLGLFCWCRDRFGVFFAGGLAAHVCLEGSPLAFGVGHRLPLAGICPATLSRFRAALRTLEVDSVHANSVRRRSKVARRGIPAHCIVRAIRAVLKGRKVSANFRVNYVEGVGAMPAVPQETMWAAHGRHATFGDSS